MNNAKKHYLKKKNNNKNNELKEVFSLLKNSVEDAFNTATKKSFDKVIDFNINLISNVLIGVPSHICGIFISTFIEILIHRLLDTQQNLRKIKLAVSALIQEPLMTGIEQLKDANKITPSSKDERLYKIDRFRLAQESFDRAKSLAPTNEVVAFIDLLHGFCSLKIPGGISEGIDDLNNFLKWAKEEIVNISLEIKKKKQKIKEAEAEKPELIFCDTTQLIGAEFGIRLRIERLSKDIDELNSKKRELKCIIPYVSNLLQIAQRIVDDD